MLCPRCQSAWPADRARCPNDGWKLVADRVGDLVAGRFEVERLLGVGGGGSAVWVAHEWATQTRIALKLLVTTDAQEQQRFERGALLAESLEHPNIARVMEHGRDGDLHWISMELLEGETLASRMGTVGKTMTPKAAVQIADQILAALEAAHAGEIVHRDLKPANLFLTPTPDGDRVRILDFGIARLVGPNAAERFGPFFPDDEPIAPELEHEVTGEHRICGTPEYMAPEQIMGADPDIRSDFYALGIILYRMVSGQAPFRARTRYEIYHRHLHEAPPPLPPLVLAPLSFASAIARAMSKNPADRFGSAAEMRATLRASVGMAPIKRLKLFPTEYEIRAAPEPTGFGQLPTNPLGMSPLPLAAPADPDPVPAPPASAPKRTRRRLFGLVGVGAIIAAAVAYFAVAKGNDAPAKPSISSTSPPASDRF